MGLLDGLLGAGGGGGLFGMPSGSQRQSGGMSPMMLALLGVLAYRTFKGKGRLAEILGGGGNAASTGGVMGGLGGLGGLLSGGQLSGGLGDLLNRFRANGHGDKAESWVGTGANQPMAPHEIEQALGPERIQWLMEQTGMTKQDLLAGLSRHLPEAVNQLTPQGRLPTETEAQGLI